MGKINEILAIEGLPGCNIITDWQKSLSIILDHPVQASLFIVNFAFLLLVEPPVLFSILLLSALVYFVFAFSERLSRSTDLPESKPALAEVAVAASPAAETFEASPEPPKNPARQVAQNAGGSPEPAAKPQRPRRRAPRS